MSVLYGLVFVTGGALASLSPVSLALQGNVMPPHDLNRSSAIYNAFYAIGMLVGPQISGEIFERMSGRAMTIHFAILWAFFVLFTIVFRRDDPRVRREVRSVPA